MSVNNVNGVKQAAVQKNTNSDNRVRNGVIGLGAGVVGGGAAGYFTKSILKDGEYSDEFLSKGISAFVKTFKDEELFKQTKAMLELSKIDDSKISVSKMKKIIEKYGEILEFEGLNGDALKNASDDEVKKAFSAFKEILLDDSSKSLTSLKEDVRYELTPIFDNLYDRAGKKFKELGDCATEEAKKALPILKKVERNIKLKQAAIYGGIAAAAAGVIAYFVTPKGKVKEAMAAKTVEAKDAKSKEVKE